MLETLNVITSQVAGLCEQSGTDTKVKTSLYQAWLQLADARHRLIELQEAEREIGTVTVTRIVE